MKPQLFHFDNIKFNSHTKLLVDTNVLLLIFVDSVDEDNSSNVRQYDKLWEYALQQENELYVTSLTISEFVNVQTRRAYNQYLEKNNKYSSEYQYKKDFQKEGIFKAVYNSAIAKLKDEILPLVKVIDFEPTDFHNIDTYTQIMNDLNDALFYKLALRNNFGILTDDSDFFFIDVPGTMNIYTLNPAAITQRKHK